MTKKKYAFIAVHVRRNQVEGRLEGLEPTCENNVYRTTEGGGGGGGREGTLVCDPGSVIISGVMKMSWKRKILYLVYGMVKQKKTKKNVTIRTERYTGFPPAHDGGIVRGGRAGMDTHVFPRPARQTKRWR